MGYSKRIWACPFYRNDKKLTISCECGVARFPRRKSLERYAKKYCGNVNNWHRCTLAADRCQDFDVPEENNSKNGGVDRDET